MSEHYPGGTASIEQVLDLAREYHRAHRSCSTTAERVIRCL